MITTITLNPAVDVRYNLDYFALDQSHRCADYQKTAGGKGLNVSRVLKILGHEIQATGFLGGGSGEFIAGELKKLDIDNRFVQIDQETRTCIAILSEGPVQTEILEAGPEIGQKYAAEFMERYVHLLKDATVICASGSLPRGLPEDYYCLLIRKAHEKKIKFILDTSGAALKKAIAHRPFLIKPNRAELEDLCGKACAGEKELVEQALALHQAGAENVVVSLGAEGAIYLNAQGAYKASVPEISCRNPVGSGDAMIAGFAHAVTNKMSLEDSLRFACACGIANAMEAETGKINCAVMDELRRQIRVVAIY
ncbi:1-phosphofructokinase [Desulforamulus ruminis]|uniref:Tagatose-6-phosphate kinase n=1 Tax=Desulforamulus ruminis (strain ATCC 23193 / DSM 2154 / NCIMB 8452 / DL) TaxID=696281 RepID=F6DQM2_DESRL|nr:1-phosphofructokinase [Desulforamulus ruminis]AEG62019.1 1-phosphofructokinase [Desulforamulus ruminis DSM 2154]